MQLPKEILEIKQSRSKFQIEKFVLGQHDTSEMQYYQLCMEIETLVYSLCETELNIKKIEAEIEELNATGKKSDAVEAEIKALHLQRTQSSLIGTRRELVIMKQLFDKFPKYTREDIEAIQEEHWRKKLIRVGQLQMLASHTGVNWAQLDAIQQGGFLPVARQQLENVQMLEDRPSEPLFTAPLREKQEQ